MLLSKRMLSQTLLAVLLMVSATCSQESFLTWSITDTTSLTSTEAYFTLVTFQNFYSCLCNPYTTHCQLSISHLNFLDFTGSVRDLTKAPSKITRYQCLHRPTDVTINCYRVDSSDNDICSTKQHCARYRINQSLRKFYCDLPYVDISVTPNVTLIPTSNSDIVNVSTCAEGCGITSPTAPPTQEISKTASSTPSPLPSPTTRSSSSWSPSSIFNSDLTKREIFITIGVLVGPSMSMMLLIFAIVVLCIVIRKRWKQQNLSQTIEDDQSVHHSGTVNTAEDDNVNGNNSSSVSYENVVYENQLMTTFATSGNDDNNMNSDNSICSSVDVMYQNQLDNLETIKRNNTQTNENDVGNTSTGVNENNDDGNISSNNNDGNDHNRNNINDDDKNEDDGYMDCESQPAPKKTISTPYFNTLLQEVNPEVDVSSDNARGDPLQSTTVAAQVTVTQDIDVQSPKTRSSNQETLIRDGTKQLYEYYNQC